MNISEIFSKYRSSILPIGYSYLKLPKKHKKEFFLKGKYRGQEIYSIPSATAFIAKISEESTIFITANHVIPKNTSQINSLVLFILPNPDSPINIKQVTREDVKAYCYFFDNEKSASEDQIIKYQRLENEDLFVCEINTPEALWKKRIIPPKFTDSFRVGNQVCTIGYPFVGFDYFNRSGIAQIRFVDRVTSAILSSCYFYNETLTMEFDNYVGPGNSGGPLFDIRSGGVIGIVTSSQCELGSPQPVSYATSINEIAKIRHEFENLPKIKCDLRCIKSS